MAKRGRPRIYETPEQKAEATKAWRAKAKGKTKNITVDADLAAVLTRVCDELAEELGFRPTISQALRLLIKRRAS